ncbi:MAG TPA: hypothetical protein VN944_06670, partial [Nitrospiria bacterium]|nr:hypothetical protein [Nitrospiria bacterium]
MNVFRRKDIFPWALKLLLAFSVIFPSSAVISLAEEAHQHNNTVVAAADTDTSWQDKLKQQLLREEAAEGKAGQSDQVDAAMQKLMEEISGGGHKGHGASGPYQDMSTMQQMDKSFFLGPGTVSETVGNGGHCPAGAPK